MRCEDLFDHVARADEGTLGAPERRALEAHVAACPSCGARLTSERRLSKSLAGWGDALASRIGCPPYEPAAPAGSSRGLPWVVISLALVAAGAVTWIALSAESPRRPAPHAAPAAPPIAPPSVPPETTPPPAPLPPTEPPPTEPARAGTPVPPVNVPPMVGPILPPAVTPGPGRKSAPPSSPATPTAHPTVTEAPTVPRVEPATMEIAAGALGSLVAHLKDRGIPNEDLVADLDLVAKAYRDLERPESAVPATPAEVREFRADAEKQLLRALVLQALRLRKGPPRNGTNARVDVNLKAATLLGDVLAHDPAREKDLDVAAAKDLERRRGAMAREIERILEKDLYKPDWQVPTALTEAVFAVLGRMNHHAALAWLVENYVHTRNVPEDVDQLVAAHKAMILFTDVPGKQRYALVDAFLRIYPSTEAVAERSSPEPKAQAAKRFWDRIKTDAVAVVRYYAVTPTNDKGEALSTMQEFAAWFRAHDKPNREPWVDPP